MTAISKKENLKQSHLDYILLALSKTTDLDKIKSNFQSFFETGIKGELLLEISRDYIDTIKQMRNSLPFQERVTDIDIASPEQQLRFLSELRKECMEERVVNVTRSGEPIYKVDLPTAARCIELANRVLVNEKTLELKRRELEEMGRIDNPPALGGPSTDVQAGPVIQIVHRKTAKEALE